ncbi:MAG: hypothetical protein KGQ66_08800 [Acidobacteriota bacterium]|nr:hypothetical protein [Acidobacteriota bacterium]
MPGSLATVTLHSLPYKLGLASVGPGGSFTRTYVLPATIQPDTHHIEVQGTKPDGSPVAARWYFQVDGQGQVSYMDPVETNVAPLWPAAALVRTINGVTYERYFPTEHARSAIVITGVAVVTIIATVGAGALTGLGSSGGAIATGLIGAGSGEARDKRGSHRKRKSSSVASAKVKHQKGVTEGEHWGDASFTWRSPGHSIIDRWSAKWPARTAAFSPLVARVLNDGSYLRAMIGSLSLTTPIIGLLLGISALASTGANPIPPSTFLVTTIIILGVFDALAGFIAAAVFDVGVAVGGGITSAAGLREQMGMSILLFAAPLVASAIRPLRRSVSLEAADVFDRCADAVMASLFAGWAVVKMIGALPALAGLKLPLVSDSNRIALAVIAAVVLRYALETVATVTYPARVALVAPAKVPAAARSQQLISLGVATASFVFVAYAYMGNVWELYVGAALTVVPSLASMYDERLVRNVPAVYRILPKGIVKTVAMMAVGTLAASALAKVVHDPLRLMAIGFVVLSLPGLALSLLGVVGREGPTAALTWSRRAAGTAIFVLGVLIVQGVIIIPSL